MWSLKASRLIPRLPLTSDVIEELMTTRCAVSQFDTLPPHRSATIMPMTPAEVATTVSPSSWVAWAMAASTRC
ncbi:Uncharacterised protein [Mycobacteroides abscessus subsp. abscessus]|nr:Uncharacterised protein [Mycobacteroides abscessus subsp. abscessus]